MEGARRVRLSGGRRIERQRAAREDLVLAELSPSPGTSFALWWRLRALGVVTNKTRLQPCGTCGGTVRAVLVIYYSKTFLGGLVRGRCWSIIPGSHPCASFFNSSHPVTRKES